MTYNKALKIVGEQSSLIGKSILGKEITNIIVAPYHASEDQIGEIADRIFSNKTYKDILDKYTDFTVIVIFQIELYYLSGILFFKTLESVLRELEENKK